MEESEKEQAELVQKERTEAKEKKKVEKEKIKEEKEEKAAEKKEKEETEKEKEAQEAKKEGNKIKVDEQLEFAELTVNMDYVRVYEEDNKEYAEISFDWLNQAGDGKKMFMQLSGMDVEQSGKILEETSGAWDAMNKNTSRIYFPNAQNGEISISVVYELENTNDPITVTFVPLTGEGSEKLTIDIE